jgi:hypothetical protein
MRYVDTGWCSRRCIRFDGVARAVSVLAKPALQGPAVLGAGDGDDVEIQPFGRIGGRYERDLAQKSTAGAVVAFGSEDLESLVVQAAVGGRFAFIGRLHDRCVGNRIAQQSDQRADPQCRVGQSHVRIRSRAAPRLKT